MLNAALSSLHRPYQRQLERRHPSQTEIIRLLLVQWWNGMPAYLRMLDLIGLSIHRLLSQLNLKRRYPNQTGISRLLCQVHPQNQVLPDHWTFNPTALSDLPRESRLWPNLWNYGKRWRGVP